MATLTQVRVGDRVRITNNATETHWVAMQKVTRPHQLRGHRGTVISVEDTGDGVLLTIELYKFDQLTIDAVDIDVTCHLSTRSFPTDGKSFLVSKHAPGGKHNGETVVSLGRIQDAEGEHLVRNEAGDEYAIGGAWLVAKGEKDFNIFSDPNDE